LSDGNDKLFMCAPDVGKWGQRILGAMRVFWPLCCLMLLLGAASARAQPFPSQDEPPMRVMSDTPEFCSLLVSRFAHVRATRESMPPDSLTLADEGERMCAMGHIRAGIVRMRMAFFALRSKS
jgi:hypothetical protein